MASNLNKLFIYVPVGVNENFKTSVIDKYTAGDQTTVQKYQNKIVFLEKSGQLWVKGKYFGGDAGSLSAQISAVDAKVTAVEKKIPVVTGSGSTYVTVDDVADSAGKHTYTVNSATLNTKIAALEKADTDLGKRITDEVGAVDRKIPSVAVSGSGLSIVKSEGDNPTYTITADARLWEFMGSITDETAVDNVASVLNGKYGTGEGKVRAAKEQGDVWAVNVAGQGTLMYAWDGTNWVTIGAANGVSQVLTNTIHGVGLTNTNGVLGISVGAGEIKAGNDIVVTGDTVHKYLANYDTSAQVDEKFTTKLAPYAKTAEVDAKLQPYAKTADVDTKLAAKLDVTTAASTYVTLEDANNLWETYSA